MRATECEGRLGFGLISGWRRERWLVLEADEFTELSLAAIGVGGYNG